MPKFKALATLLPSAAGTADAQQAPPPAQVTPLMSKALADHPGKEGVVITVDYPAGEESPVHRHNAHAFDDLASAVRTRRASRRCSLAV
jgi:hypothetical protein